MKYAIEKSFIESLFFISYKIFLKHIVIKYLNTIIEYEKIET